MPLLWLSLAYICGVLLGRALSISPTGWYLVGGLALPLLALPVIVRRLVIEKPGFIRKLISRLNPRTLQGLLRPLNRLRAIRLGIAFPWLVLVLCLGAVRYHASLPAPEANSLANFNDLDASLFLEGTVIAAPEQRDGYINLLVQASSLRMPGSVTDQVVQGQVLARLDPGKEWRYGDHVRLEGKLYTPTENETFSYRQYLAQRGIYSQMQVKHSVNLDGKSGNLFLTALYALRTRSLAVLYQIYPDPEAALLAGILLGIEQGIPEKVNEAFRVTGTAHIIAISG